MNSDDLAIIKEVLDTSDEVLNEREKRVIEGRIFTTPPVTFRALATEFKLKSAQRPRDILLQAMCKLRQQFVFKRDYEEGLYDRNPPPPTLKLNGHSKPKKVKPSREHAFWAKQTIEALEAFLRGDPVQWKCAYSNWKWCDFDLALELKGQQYWRAKPKE